MIQEPNFLKRMLFIVGIVPWMVVVVAPTVFSAIIVCFFSWLATGNGHSEWLDTVLWKVTVIFDLIDVR